MHYDLAVEFTPTLVLRDRESDDIKRLWSGSVAASIIASGILPPVCVQGGRYRCDKSLIWRLLLTATAAGLAEEEQARAQGGGCLYGQESIAEKLSQHGVYPTWQRMRVALALFDEVAKHYTASQVCAKLKATGERCCRATVYNCLKLFTEKKLLQEIVVDRELVFYDTVTSPHAHVYDMAIGELRDLDLHRDLHTFSDDVVVEGARMVLLVRSRRFEKASAQGGCRGP